MNVLALCGSIRENSSNHNLLSAIRSFFPTSTAWELFEIKRLPFFDPALQISPALPAAVRELRALAAKSDYIVISSPEYAHGIPGILKNALEWLVCEETVKKKAVMVIGSASGGEYVKEYLAETLRTMDLVLPPSATAVVRTARNQISPQGEILDPNLRATLAQFISGLLA